MRGALVAAASVVLCLIGLASPALASAADRFTWTEIGMGSAPTMFDISCTPTASLCLAVGDEGQTLVSSDPTGGPPAWHQFDLTGKKETLWKDSCPDAGLCVIGTSSGELMTATEPTAGATAWSTFKVPGASIVEDLSCASESLCVAVVPGELLVSTEPTGGAAAWKPVAAGARAVSCPSTTFCLATDGPTAWVSSEPADGAAAWTPIATGSSVGAEIVSCASAAFCADVNFSDGVISSSSPAAAGSWHGEVLPGLGNTWGISCPTSSFCAINGGGAVYTSTEPAGGAATWTREAVGDGANDISCPSPDLCVADGLWGVVVGTPAPPVIDHGTGDGGGSGGGTTPPPVVKILTGPRAETTEQSARFTFTGVDGGAYECSVDDGPWATCSSGQAFSPVAPGDHRFSVRETLNGVTGPIASYRWTVDLPKACILKVARARVFAFTHQGKARLVIHYKAYKPAQVTVSYSLEGARGGVSLGTASTHFKTAGIYKRTESLGRADVAKLRATNSMKVRFQVPQAPGSCTRYYAKRLTIPKSVSGQTVWFQSDSVFGPEGG